MARNSRFRSTSGPSSNRPRTDKSDKGKSFRKGSGTKRNSIRKEGDRNLPFSKYRSKDQASEPGTEGKVERQDGLPEKSGDFARRRQFSKGNEAKSPGSEGERGKRFSRPNEERRGGGQKSGDFGRRAVRPFSKEGFKRRSPGTDEGEAKNFSRSGADEVGPRKVPASAEREAPGRGKSSSDFRRKEGGFQRSDEPGRGKRKSFGESRHDNKRAPRAEENIVSGTPNDLIRLNKYISNSGVCSRREADDLITMGLITVNGKSIIELGYKVKATDDVRYEGRRLKAEKPVYILLNKPKGYITTTDDPQERNTVMQLIQGACKERVYPVGRLDRNTSGLLLLTNDGDLTDKLTHPSYNVKKIYKAELNKPLTKGDFQKIIDGVHLEEGKAVVDELAVISEDGKTVGLEIHIGWNRVIRRIFEALDYEVIKLDRSVYATLDKKDLSRGHWRFLRQDEVIRIKHFQ